MSWNTLEEIAEYIVSNGKGILAADESNPTCGKRFDSIGVESTETNRRDYREMLFRATGMQDNIGGVILFDETIKQSAEDGTPLVELIKNQGALPGIKVDKGLSPIGDSEESLTQGLDGLDERLKEYFELGAKFTKWRAVINIGEGMPSPEAISANMEALADYAKIVQNNNMVPMVGESNTYVECLTNSSGYPCIAVNKLSDSNIITHGTQTVIASVATSNANIANDPTDGSRGMVTYESSSNTFTGKVYTITGSGTSPSDYTITLSSSATTITTYANGSNVNGLWMDPHTAGRFVFLYNWDDGTAGNMDKYQSVAMGLVSGTGSSASIGSVTEKTQVDTSGSASYYYTYQCIGFDPNTANKLLLVYGVYGLPFPTSPYDRIQARVGILSSSTSYAPTWGTAVVFNSASSNDTISLCRGFIRQQTGL